MTTTENPRKPPGRRLPRVPHNPGGHLNLCLQQLAPHLLVGHEALQARRDAHLVCHRQASP